MGTDFFIIIICLAIILLLLGSIVIVGTGMAYIVESFGVYRYTLRSGIHFIIPLYHRIGKKLSLLEQSTSIPLPEHTTEDGKAIKINGSMSFIIEDAYKAAYEKHHLSKALKDLVENHIKKELKELTLLEIKDERGKINKHLIKTCNQIAAEWGTKIIDIDLGDLNEIKK